MHRCLSWTLALMAIGCGGSGGGGESDDPSPSPKKAIPAFLPSSQLLGQSSATSLALADLDSDGDLDLIEAFAGAFATVRWDQGGTYGAATAILAAHDASLVRTGDFNGDGHPDAVFLKASGITAAVNSGQGLFVYATTFGPAKSLAVGDINRDGFDDIVALEEYGIRVWTSNGKGGFFASNTLTGNSAPMRCLLLADLNGDKWLDVVTGQNGSDSLFANIQGVLTYQQKLLDGEDTVALAAGDLDGDGNIDLIESTSQGPTRVWPQLPGGQTNTTGITVTYPKPMCSGPTSKMVGLRDLDQDGLLDILSVENGGLFVRYNNGSCTPKLVGPISAGPAILSVAIGDVDLDGDSDLVIAAGSTGIWLNQLIPSGK